MRWYWIGRSQWLTLNGRHEKNIASLSFNFNSFNKILLLFVVKFHAKKTLTNFLKVYSTSVSDIQNVFFYRKKLKCFEH